MILPFYKYHGTGNDFIMIDNRPGFFDITDTDLIASLCARHTGIGADGLITLEPSGKYDFAMRYFNADGRESTMCGNGGRCIVAFANKLGIIESKTEFEAVDGLHRAEIHGDTIRLLMKEVEKPGLLEQGDVFLDTGSPHHVRFVDNLRDLPVYELGRKIRYGMYGTAGSNVNFVETGPNGILRIRTYERGVENETLSCGTGVTAAAIAAFETGRINRTPVELHTPGGILKVFFTKENSSYREVWLEGPATGVFYGKIEI